MATYIDNQGHTQVVELDAAIYKDAAAANMSVEAYINHKYPVASGDAPAFQQMLASEGIFMKTDRKTGIHASRLKDVLEGTTPGASVSNTRDAVPQSRILMPAAVLSAVENQLARDLETSAAAMDRMIALTENIQGQEFKRVVVNYQRPSSYRSRATSQLSKPAAMLTLTVSERSNTIPSMSLGIEWSDQLTQNMTMDVVAMSILRQVAVQRNAIANEDLLAVLNGDEDYGMEALSTYAGVYVEASDLDTSITGTGELTQTAWVKWLYKDSNFRTIDWIVTDLDGALAIENRKGKPVVVGDDATSPRIDSQMRVANPLIPANVNVFVTDNPDWPAGTIMGLDSRYALFRVNSLTANYSAIEQDLIRRANTMRWDSGTALYRGVGGHEAFSVLELK